jgi:hypothetical protein
MSPESSVTTWIASLKQEDALAAQRLWDRYSARLADLARSKIKRSPLSIADEDDVALSVFRILCRGAANGRFQEVKNRDDLWWVILDLTRKKVVDLKRYDAAARRGGGRILSETALTSPGDDAGSFTLDRLMGDDPTPEFMVMLDEQFRRLLGLLRDDCLRQIAILRIEGYSVAEIASQLNMGMRSVERKLQLIRATWASELAVAYA